MLNWYGIGYSPEACHAPIASIPIVSAELNFAP